MKKIIVFSKRTLVIIVVIVMISLSFVAMSQSNTSARFSYKADTSTTNSTSNGTLYLSPGPTPAFVDNYNPFDGVWLTPAGIMGLIYEPLLQMNTYNGTVIPWLATSYSWNSNATVLTMQLRHNVEFSNGMTFNASDVLFTFHEQDKLFDEWPTIKTITAPNPYEVQFNFTKPSSQYLFYVASDIIVPKQLFYNVSNPLKTVVTDPIGTGPYILKSFSPEKIVLTANPNYWQKGEPKIKNIVYVDYVSNTALTLAMQQGQVDWASYFAPNITSLFVIHDSKYNHYWFPEGQPVTLLVNNLMYPLNLPYFRQAISVAINRTEIEKIGEYGYEKPANAAGLLAQQLPELNSTNLASANKLAEFNISYAQQLLEAHGFTIKNNALYEPNGTKLPSISLMSVSGYSDWDTDISIIAGDLNQLGISVTIETPTASTVTNDVTTGDYQLALDVDTGIGPNAWYDYSGLVGTIEPAGTNAYVNPERWNDTGTNFSYYFSNFSKITNVSEQDVYINHMASVMLKQMPIVYLTYSADWYEYVNSSIGGWPSAKNPYWIPMPWYPGPNEVVILHLYVKNNIANKGINNNDYYIIAGVIVAAIAVAGTGIYLRKKKIKGEQ